MKKIILIIIIGIGLMGILSGAYYLLKDSNYWGFIETTQPLKDTSVILEKVHLAKPGYVAVHENNDGEPGEIIGTSEFMTGVEENLVIFNMREVESVIVRIYYGNGNFPFDIQDFKVDNSEEATIVINK